MDANRKLNLQVVKLEDDKQELRHPLETLLSDAE